VTTGHFHSFCYVFRQLALLTSPTSYLLTSFINKGSHVLTCFPSFCRPHVRWQGCVALHLGERFHFTPRVKGFISLLGESLSLATGSILHAPQIPVFFLAYL
jgi:hypothetical protein